jgi:hypothetical protein
MATLVALTEPCLVPVVAQGFDKGLEIAVNIFEGVTEVSPSLADMGAILRERVQCINLVRRI